MASYSFVMATAGPLSRRVIGTHPTEQPDVAVPRTQLGRDPFDAYRLHVGLDLVQHPKLVIVERAVEPAL